MKHIKNSRIISAIIIIILLMIMLFIVLKFTGRSEETKPEYVFSYATVQVAGHPTVQAAERFAELVKNATGDRIRIVVKSDGELGTENDVYRQMQCGGIDMASLSLSQLTSVNKGLYLLELPYLFRDEQHFFDVLDSELGNELLSGIDDGGVIGLTWLHTGPRGFFTISPLDVNGLDFSERYYRVPDTELFKDMVVSLKAYPEIIDIDQVYSSLEDGEVFGADSTLYSYNQRKYYQVAPYYYIDNHTMSPEIIVFSKPIWQKLSLNDRSILMECAKEAGLYERELWAEEQEKAIAAITENGAVVTSVPDDQKLKFYYMMSDLYYEYAGDYIDTVRQIYFMN